MVLYIIFIIHTHTHKWPICGIVESTRIVQAIRKKKKFKNEETFQKRRGLRSDSIPQIIYVIVLERVIRLLLSNQCVREVVNISHKSCRYYIILCYYNNNDNNNSILLRPPPANFLTVIFSFNIYSHFCFLNETFHDVF